MTLRLIVEKSVVKVKNSEFLKRIKPEIAKIVRLLERKFDYVSILGTDTFGYKYLLSGGNSSIEESMWTERGFAARIIKDGRVFEYSFNMVDTGVGEEIAAKITEFVESAVSDDFRKYDIPKEEPLSFSFNDEVKIDPIASGPDGIFPNLKHLYDKAVDAGEHVFNARVVYEWVQVAKIFVSSKKNLEQSYIWSQAYLVPMVKERENIKVLFVSDSGIGGVEILKNLEDKVERVVSDAESLLSAENIVPGEYEVICAPDVSGLIAHEAFGHGVEMDMFVKNRALGKEYIGKKVASDVVSMRDAAFPVRQCGSFRFDDEGTISGNNLVIDKGILQQGISDSLSAAALGTVPTGNGRRQSYLNKTYSRMTNTYFEGGSDSLESMIASVQNGYLIDYTQSGMEDPKNWGLQAVAFVGREIKDGKLTGRVVSPVVMTGYVPDILNNITMVSGDIELFGSGYCGKGWKEFVKVSSGGPYIKTKMRLG